MTTREVSDATGIQQETVRRNIRRGRLQAAFDGVRWNIEPEECLAWARLMWSMGRVRMFPPDRAEKFLHDFDIKKTAPDS